MKPKVWEKEVKRDCPGIGIGRLYPAAEIERMLKTERQRDERH